MFEFRSPDGERALLTMEAEGTTVLTLIDATGTPLAGFGTDVEIAPTGRSSVAGTTTGRLPTLSPSTGSSRSSSST